jgi:hypothetical protein
MTSFKTPTKAQIDKAVQRMRSTEHAAYFLSRLQNPKWIIPLRDNGLFKDAPPVIQVDGDRKHFPHWPASKYLARMAKQAPNEVADIFSKIETDNSSIIGDILDAALAMQADVAVSLVPVICRAARDGALWICFDEASELCVQLAEGGKPDAAMKLAKALFAFEEGREKPIRRDEFWYKDGLKKVMPVLARRKPHDFLPKLCDWLKALIDAKDFEPNSGSDFSYSWRPAIEEHEQNSDYDFAGVMVGVVREAFEVAIRSKSISLNKALKIVERYTYLVFKRMRLHLIGEFADQNPKLTRQEMLNRKLFDDREFKHEYAMLAGKRLDILTSPEREEWFGWIDAGPDYDEIFQDRPGRKATEQDRQNRINYWKFEKLHWVRVYLDGERKNFYDQMLAKHGEPHTADLHSYIGPVSEEFDDSPMMVEELQGMTFEKAVDKVSSWQPEGSRFMGPSVEGLASTFASYVATNPEGFSAEAHVLIGRPAIFVHRFISEMSDSVKNNREIDLTAVLELCQWAIERPIKERTTPTQEDEMLVDKDWQWTRDDVSQFIENICKAKRDDVPRYPLGKIRKIIWKLIEPLCLDIAESYIVHDVSKDDPRVHDYLDLGINSPRGRAVQAALEYARWVANQIKESEGKKEIVPDGFEAMPEVREMLEGQIATGKRSFEVMSIIGSKFGLIYWIDKEWLSKNVEKIFQLEGIEQTPSAAEGWAAWNAFLVWVRPHIEFYRLFKSQFAYAVKQAAKVELTEDTHQRPMCHLGEHLMLLYGRGQLGLDDDAGLLRSFLKTANPKIRRYTIGFVGRGLRGEEKAPQEVIERFKTLWDIYWNSTGRKDAKEHPDSWLFGTWFSCGQFPDQWALDRLEEFVEVVKTPEPDHRVVEKLADIAHIDIAKSVRILDLMVRGDREGWHIDSWLDSAKKILEQAMKNNGEVREKAVALIDYLGRRGYSDFGTLLNRS